MDFAEVKNLVEDGFTEEKFDWLGIDRCPENVWRKAMTIPKVRMLAEEVSSGDSKDLDTLRWLVACCIHCSEPDFPNARARAAYIGYAIHFYKQAVPRATWQDICRDLREAGLRIPEREGARSAYYRWTKRDWLTSIDYLLPSELYAPIRIERRAGGISFTDSSGREFTFGPGCLQFGVRKSGPASARDSESLTAETDSDRLSRKSCQNQALWVPWNMRPHPGPPGEGEGTPTPIT